MSIFAGLYRPTYYLNCQNISYDETRLDDWFKTTANDPAGIYLIDAPDRARMDLAIKSVKRSLGKCHFVGSGGLTRSLAQYVTAPDTHAPFQHLSPALWLIGSAAKVSHKQLDQLGLEKFEANEHGELSGKNHARMISLLQQNISVVAHLPLPNTMLPLSPDLLNQFINTAVPSPISARTLIMTGGATARAALNKLGVHHIDLIDEILPGIPIGATMIDNQICHIVLKSGGFGDDQALRSIQSYLNAHFPQIKKEHL